MNVLVAEDDRDIADLIAHYIERSGWTAHIVASGDEALAKARQQLANGREPEQVLEFLAHTLTNRLLHPPTAALREAALSGDGDLVRAADRLFPAQAPYSHSKKDDDADAAP